MDAAHACALYTSIRLHFNSETYDCFKYNFKTNAKGFELNRNRYQFSRLSRMFSEDECKKFLAANFFAQPSTFIRDLLEHSAREIFTERRIIQESLSYTFEKDIRFIFSQHKDPNDSISCTDGYPKLLVHVWESDISVESLIVLNHLLHFFPKWNRVIEDSIQWPQFYFRVRKYTPFMTFEGESMKRIVASIMKEFNIPK